MTKRKEPESAVQLERAVIETGAAHYVLKLYVTGMSPRSAEAVAMVRELGRELLEGHYELEVVDLYQQPGRARSDDILASPTLVKEKPAPRRKLVGNLSDRKRVRRGLDIPGDEP